MEYPVGGLLIEEKIIGMESIAIDATVRPHSKSGSHCCIGPVVPMQSPAQTSFPALLSHAEKSRLKSPLRSAH